MTNVGSTCVAFTRRGLAIPNTPRRRFARSSRCIRRVLVGAARCVISSFVLERSMRALSGTLGAGWCVAIDIDGLLCGLVGIIGRAGCKAVNIMESLAEPLPAPSSAMICPSVQSTLQEVGGGGEVSEEMCVPVQLSRLHNPYRLFLRFRL